MLTTAASSDTCASNRLSAFALAASIKADAASRVAARKDMIWIKIRHVARAETKAITARVMVALNVNVRFRSMRGPSAGCDPRGFKPKAKKRGAGVEDCSRGR